MARASGIRLLSAPALLILPALTGGCSGRSAPARFYMLAAVPHSPVATPSTEPGRAPELGIGPVTLPRYLERTNIVTRRGMEMEVAEFDRWAEPLSESVPRAIAANLATLLRTERIVVFPWSNTASIERQIVIDVIRFGQRTPLHRRARPTGAPDSRDLRGREHPMPLASSRPSIRKVRPRQEHLPGRYRHAAREPRVVRLASR